MKGSCYRRGRHPANYGSGVVPHSNAGDGARLLAATKPFRDSAVNSASQQVNLLPIQRKEAKAIPFKHMREITQPSLQRREG